MKPMKKIFCTMMALLLLFAVTACSSSPASPSDNAPPSNTQNEATKSPDNTPSNEPVTIRFFTNVPDRTGGLGLLEQTNMDLYMAQNENVKIEMETLQDEPYKMKLQTYMQSDDMPDVWMQWGSLALLYPVLQGQFAAELNAADYADYGFVPGALDSFSSDGKLYGLPKNADFWVLYYNQKILDDNGIAVPKSTDDLIAAAAKLKEKNISCISLAGKDKWPTVAILQNIILRKTGDPAVLRNAILNGNAAGNADLIDGLNEFIRLADNGVFQPSFNADDYGTSKNLFIQGQAAMLVQGSWEMGMGSDESISPEIRENIRAIPFPSINGWNGNVNDLAMWYGGGYSVSAKSAVKDEAIRFVSFLVSPAVYAKNAWEMQVLIPPMKYDQYLTGAENDLQKDLTNIISSATSTTGDLFNDLHTPSFKTDSENATLEFSTKMIGAEEFLSQLDTYAKEANE